MKKTNLETKMKKGINTRKFNDTEVAIGCVLFMTIFIAALILNYFSIAGLVALLCWCFNYIFTWKLATGVWVITSIFTIAFASNT